MGWRCKMCGNTERFIEINRVATFVTQEKDSTTIKKTFNKYMQEPLLSVRCGSCENTNLEWIDVPNQENAYLFEKEGFLSEDHHVETMVIELTNRCNINCIYCPKQGNTELDFELMKKLIEENKQIQRPIRHFELGWDMGNPLLDSRIHQIMQMFEPGWQVNILTNGRDFIRLASKLDIGSVIGFTFFLDHPEAKTNDKLMGKGVYAATLKAFAYLNSLNKSFKVYMRLGRHNYNQVNAMQKLVVKHGAHLTPTEIYPIGKASESMCMTDEMKLKAAGMIDKLGLNKSIHFSDSRGNCTYHRGRRMLIDAHGRLSFCHFLSSLNKAAICDIRDKTLLELIQINHKVRNGFLRNKKSKFSLWKLPRQTASPCSYCLHAFGLDKKW